MYIKIDKEGCYQAVVSYGDVKLKNGEFDILVLNGEGEHSQFDILVLNGEGEHSQTI